MIALRPNHMLMLSASFLLLAGCSPPSTHAAAESAKAAAQPAPEPKQSTACEMVTAAEMAVLLGGSVTAQAGPTNGQTSCIYKPVSDSGPAAELKIEWGSGEGGMLGAGLANSQEPGLADPLAGLGDRAVSMGPAIMIKRGDDLVTILLSGVDDRMPPVRGIYALVDKRM
jgi:hypothetical protein